MSDNFAITAHVVDILHRATFPAELRVAGSRIEAIEPRPDANPSTWLIPGLIDAHVHIESSLLVPSEFARAAVLHGTVATVSDPHEIGNVLGVSGVTYMLNNAAQSPFKFFFGAPSCVPATTFETAGAEITSAEVTRLLDDPRILYLSEMMNFPGILQGNPDCLAKVQAAHDRGKPVDGHAPGLRGDEARRYLAAGITTDHECFTREEALDKLAAGCKISIREGSAARNFDALCQLLGEYPGQTMLCSDDKHPDELLEGHIDVLVRRAIAKGIDLYDALRAACITPVEHYGLPVGQLRVGDAADFVEVDSLTDLRVLRTWIDGQLVAADGRTTIDRVEPEIVNQFVPETVAPGQLSVAATGTQLRVIEALDGQLITRGHLCEPRIVDGQITSDPSRNLLKLVVVNRYTSAPPAIGFIQGFGLSQGAIGSSVAHDSHNVIAVGADDHDLAAAIDLVMEARGGLSIASQADGLGDVLPLPVAGLMATGTCRDVGEGYGRLDQQAKRLGSTLRSPYMTLSFMALLVIPDLKLSDRGLFDGARFKFTELVPD